MHRKAAAILQIFREQDGFVSGEHLSRELGVSRTAIWKHISAIRGAGYHIEALPSKGYRLLSSPDTLSAEEIKGKLNNGIIGTDLVHFTVTASTNVEASRLAANGAVEGTVITAEEQSRGKGRLGRTWSSPPGANLYCSIILRPRIKPFEAPQLTFLSAVATARAIALSSGLKPEIKWPNDVLITGKKVAGLLNEMSAETDRINFVILGIGVNLNMTAEQFPDDLRHPATSLFIETGVKVSRAYFTALLLNELDRLYSGFLDSGFTGVRQEWMEHCNARGREVVVSNNGTADIRGLFAGIDNDGALLLQQHNGVIERILSGDVRVL